MDRIEGITDDPSCPRGVYRHNVHGDLYEVVGVGYHTETHEKLVAYRALYGEFKFWIRPFAMFMDGRMTLVREF